MARPKKIVDKVELVSNQIEDAIVNKEEVVKEVTIFDKYRTIINEANADYLMHYQYADLVDILRYTEKFYGHNIQLKLQCSSCIIDLVKMFSRLEKK